jgi:hypothetical protein
LHRYYDGKVGAEIKRKLIPQQRITPATNKKIIANYFFISSCLLESSAALIELKTDTLWVLFPVQRLSDVDNVFTQKTEHWCNGIGIWFIEKIQRPSEKMIATIGQKKLKLRCRLSFDVI